MPKTSQNDGKHKDSTSSGHGALGMGGDPSDDPRDLKGGHEGPTNDDRTRKVDGAFGSGKTDRSGGGSSNETVGVGGDKAVDIDVDKVKRNAE